MAHVQAQNSPFPQNVTFASGSHVMLRSNSRPALKSSTVPAVFATIGMPLAPLLLGKTERQRAKPQ